MLSFLIKKLQTTARLLSTRTLLLLAIVLSGVTTVLAQDENFYYVHNDHIGRPIMLTDENQHVVWKAHYTPYGEAILEVEEIEFPLRGEGQYYDKESGLLHNNYRTYNPATGRYVQSDPIGVLRDFSDPQLQVAIKMGLPLNQGNSEGLNHPYVYANSNPIMNVDQFGLLDCKCTAVAGSFSYPRGQEGGKYCTYSCVATDGTRFSLTGPGSGDQCQGANLKETVTPTGNIATYADGYREFSVDTESILKKIFGKNIFDTAAESSYGKKKGAQ